MSRESVKRRNNPWVERRAMLTVDEWRLVLWWVVTSGLGWTLGGAVGGTASTFEYIEAIVGTVSSWLLGNFVTVLVSTLLQGLLLRPHVAHAFWWPLASLLGYIMGFVLIFVLSVAITWSVSTNTNQTLIVNANQVFALATFLGWSLVIATVAWGQWLVLRRFRQHHRNHSERWFIPTFAGWAVGLAVLVYISEDLIELARPQLQSFPFDKVSGSLGTFLINVLNSVITFAPGGVAYGAITGIAIVLLLREPSRDREMVQVA